MASTASTPASRSARAWSRRRRAARQLLDKGFYNVTGLAWSGRGKVKKVDVSVDGGRNWRTARLETPVLSKCLTRFSHRLGLGRQARHHPEPRHRRDRLRAAHVPSVARGARHALDLSQQCDPVVAGRAKRRGEECPALVSSWRRWRWRVSRRLRWRRTGQAIPASAATRRRGRSRRGTSTCVPTSRACRPGSGSVDKGQDVWEAKCASCHGVFGESNQVFNPLVGGTTADDIKTGHVGHAHAQGLPRPHHDDEGVQPVDAVGLHQPRDAVERSPSRSASRRCMR